MPPTHIHTSYIIAGEGRLEKCIPLLALDSALHKWSTVIGPWAWRQAIVIRRRKTAQKETKEVKFVCTECVHLMTFYIHRNDESKHIARDTKK